MRSQAQWLNFNNEEINKIEEAVDKTYRLCIGTDKKANTVNNRFVIKVGRKELIIGFISLNGTSVQKGDLIKTPDWQSIQQLVDQAEVIPTTPQGYIIKLAKTVKN